MNHAFPGGVKLTVAIASGDGVLFDAAGDIAVRSGASGTYTTTPASAARPSTT